MNFRTALHPHSRKRDLPRGEVGFVYASLKPAPQPGSGAKSSLHKADSRLYTTFFPTVLSPSPFRSNCCWDEDRILSASIPGLLT